MGRDGLLIINISRGSGFNPRAHVGRDRIKQLTLIMSKRFNPRAHVGRDLLIKGVIRKIAFQSTRPRGARPIENIINSNTRSFNPRAHVGRDLPPYTLSEPFAVSIHAPTWGATSTTALTIREFTFQSTRPRGARRSSISTNSTTSSFNPRAHVGRDIMSTNDWGSATCFNPRAHVGRDSQ